MISFLLWLLGGIMFYTYDRLVSVTHTPKPNANQVRIIVSIVWPIIISWITLVALYKAIYRKS